MYFLTQAAMANNIIQCRNQSCINLKRKLQEINGVTYLLESKTHYRALRR